MANLHPTLCAIVILTGSIAFAQGPGPAPDNQQKPPAVPATIPPPIQLPETPQQQPGVPVQVNPPAVVDPNAPQNLSPQPGVPIPGAPVSLPVTATRLNDFQGDPIDLVLRALAKQAKMNLVVSDAVTQTGGTVNMRIEDKSPKEAIEVIVTAKGLVMDEQKGVYFIKTPAERAKEPTESGSYTFSYAQAKDVVTLLPSQLQSGVAPQFDQRTNTIFFRENRSNMDSVKAFLTSVDTPTKQVMIEARLLEVTANPKQTYGINWAGALSNQQIAFAGSTLAQTLAQNSINGTSVGGVSGANGGTGAATVQITANNGSSVPNFTGTGAGSVAGQGTAFGNSTGGSNAITNTIASTAGNFLLDPANLMSTVAGQFAILSAPQLSVAMSLINQDSDSEFIAHPRVVTSNNLKAEIKITRNQPVPQLNFNEQTAQAVFSGFQDKEFGNTLNVTPSINKDGFISLMVQPEISNKVGDATFTFAGATVTSPVIDKRTLNSNVLIKSGDTLAIGGLLQDEQSKGRTKVPVLGDIPILGYLFQERVNSRNKRNLLIFVTPTVIEQGYGTGLESQVTGLTHSGEEYADPNGWRNNAKGAKRIVPTSTRQLAADYPKPGVPPQPKKVPYKVTAPAR